MEGQCNYHCHKTILHIVTDIQASTASNKFMSCWWLNKNPDTEPPKFLSVWMLSLPIGCEKCKILKNTERNSTPNPYAIKEGIFGHCPQHLKQCVLPPCFSAAFNLCTAIIPGREMVLTFSFLFLLFGSLFTLLFYEGQSRQVCPGLLGFAFGVHFAIVRCSFLLLNLFSEMRMLIL